MRTRGDSSLRTESPINRRAPTRPSRERGSSETKPSSVADSETVNVLASPRVIARALSRVVTTSESAFASTVSVMLLPISASMRAGSRAVVALRFVYRGGVTRTAIRVISTRPVIDAIAARGVMNASRCTPWMSITASAPNTTLPVNAIRRCRIGNIASTCTVPARSLARRSTNSATGGVVPASSSRDSSSRDSSAAVTNRLREVGTRRSSVAATARCAGNERHQPRTAPMIAAPTKSVMCAMVGQAFDPASCTMQPRSNQSADSSSAIVAPRTARSSPRRRAVVANSASSCGVDRGRVWLVMARRSSGAA